MNEEIDFTLNDRPIDFKLNAEVELGPEQSARLLEDGSFRLLEDDGFRLLE
jgi:hypothetical protein